MQPTSDKRGGFTVVELIIAIGIISAITIGLVSLIVSLVGNATRSIEATKQVRETQSALATVRDDLRLTDRFLATSSLVSDTDRNGNAWNHRGIGAGGAGSRTLLLNKRATNLASNAQNRLPLYRVTFLGTLDCLSSDPNHTLSGLSGVAEPEYNTIIYYLHDSTLYRRVAVQPTLALDTGACTGHVGTPARTCTDPTSPTKPPNCRERDVVLAQNVTRFDILYYSEPGDATGNASIFSSGATQADLDGISTIQITIQTSKDIGGRDNEFTSQIRANRGSAL